MVGQCRSIVAVYVQTGQVSKACYVLSITYREHWLLSPVCRGSAAARVSARTDVRRGAT